MTNGYYNGTQGFVPRQTSRDRLTPNLETVHDAVVQKVLMGATWKEVATMLNLHHGQASGALSNLHRLGRVFVFSGERRDGCQVYVADVWRNAFQDDECLDSPAITKSGRRNIAVVDLADTVRAFVFDKTHSHSGFSVEQWRETLKEALEKYERETK